MLKPFYQGKLDAFCAVYAVLNALRLTHGIRTLKARDILNETLLALSRDQTVFSDFLNQRTDYVALVDNVLNNVKSKMPLVIERPFPPTVIYSPDEFWRECHAWLNCGDSKRAIIFRFLRYLKPDEQPANRHWTCADKIDDRILHLFDCSHEAEAILNIKRDGFVTRACDVSADRPLLIQPDTARFARLPF